LSLGISSDDLNSNLRWIRSDLTVNNVLPVNLLTDVVHIGDLSVVSQLLSDGLSLTLAVYRECDDGDTSVASSGLTCWLLRVTHLTCETLRSELTVLATRGSGDGARARRGGQSD